MKSHSSIFSFETFKLETFNLPSLSIPLYTIAIVAIAEAIVRPLLPVANYEEYWHPEAGVVRVEADQHLKTKSCVLVLGDSTGAQNFEYSSLTNAIPKELEVWNLAWPGNFPIAFEQSSLPCIGKYQPKHVILSLIPTGFLGDEKPTDSESSILAAPVCRRLQNRWMLTDHLQLTRLWKCLKLITADLESMQARVKKYHGFPESGLKEQTGNSKSEQFLSDGNAIPRINERRFEVVRRVASICSQNDIKLQIVIPPTLDKSDFREKLNADYLAHLTRLSDHFGITITDATQEHWDSDDFYDVNHLNTKGAKRLSTTIMNHTKKIAKRI